MTPKSEGRPLVGAALVATAIFLFAAADVLVKDLVQTYPVAVVQGGRYALTIVLMLIFFWPKHRSGLWQTRRTSIVILRGLALAFASLTLGYALRVMPVGESVSIIYLSPFAVMLLSGPILGEKVKPASWLFASFAFIGVLFVMRPGSGLDPIGVILCLINAGFSTFYLLTSRSLARTESTHAMLFYTAVVGSLVFWILAIPEMPDHLPPMIDLLKIGALGALATLGHFLFTAAYREAPPSLLAPMNYTHVVWAAIMGLVIFDHMPDLYTLIGMGMVIVSGVASAIHARKPTRG